MSTRELRRRIVHVLLEGGGLLTERALEGLLAYAREGRLTVGEQRLLVRPARLVQSSHQLQAAGIGLDQLRYGPGVAARLQGLAEEWGIEPRLGPGAGAVSEPPGEEPGLEALLAAAQDLGEPVDWTLRTPGAEVGFSTEVFDRKWPALVMARPTFTDPSTAPPPLERHRDRLLQVEGEEALAALLGELLDEEQDWFTAADVVGEADSTAGVANRRFGVQRLRRDAFFDGVRNLMVARPGLGIAVNRVLLEARDDLLDGQEFHMEIGRRKNYWPYWDNFVGVLEKLASQLPAESDGALALANRIHDLHRRKHVFRHTRTIDEKDIEQFIGGVVVHREPFTTGLGHRVSLVAGAEVYSPRYELLRVAESGLPEEHSALAGAPVYRHGDGDLRFDVAPSTAAEVAWEPGASLPGGLEDHVVSTTLSKDLALGLRKPQLGELLRRDFPLDWNRSGQIQVAPIQIGWWGHCHNEAPANALGMDPRRPVTLYRADRGLEPHLAKVSYSEEDCWDIVGAFTSDHEGERIRDPRTGRVSSPGYVLFGSGGGYQPTRVDETSFVGNRNNGGHWFQIEPDFPGARRIRVDAEVTEIWGLENPEHQYAKPMSRFRRDVENDDGTFDPNPDWLASGMDDDDVITVQAAGRRMSLKARYITFDSHGRRVERSPEVSLDPGRGGFKKLAEEIEVVAPGGGGRLVEHWYDPKAQTYKAVSVELKRGEDGGWQRTTLSEREAPAKSVTASQETTYDSVVELDEYVVKDLGLPLTFDTSSGQAVWNYPVDFLRREVLRRTTREEGGEVFTYTTIQLHFDTFGGPEGDPRYILKRDALGKTVRALALDPMPDFAYRNEHWTCAPVAMDQWGRPAMNLRGLTAGYLTDAGKRRIVPELWERQAIVLYAAMAEATAGEHAWIFETEDGRLLSFPDEASFEAAVEADQQLRAQEAEGRAALV
jgi:hypothetical protein